ncbi:BlaI/MecI/CopY family transcriptional regulator [Allosaccharopolyspora coralli]|uniref:BlaI/MecI/CopY family transcriptional regulator n=1 Tax=Allosaccharopolyspora coralli TaxID=2665642 RepID=A0A5Q3Q6F8_9PSEU|nr:BlaI/MecI/CopY family transcriptional regulator [Allosaccharopolyspora coralli]QGK70231.1 BlaI/MecI/CopY family transcriptional regulator [Allosaccharopolyspora coralli]
MQGLGDLEGAVMDVLWRAYGPMSVREVLSELNTTRDLAYTTVMTVMDNLHRKGWVEREMHNRAYQYTPAEGREEAAARTLRELLDASGSPQAVLLHFAKSVSEDESAALRRGLRRRSKQ